MKICKRCGREKPLEQFPTNRGRADGHLDTCLTCWRTYTTDKSRVLAIADRKSETPPPEEEKEDPKEKPKRKPLTEEEKRERRKEYFHRYYQRHKAECDERMRAYRKSPQGREAVKRAYKKWSDGVKNDPVKRALYLQQLQQRHRTETEEQRQKRLARSKEYYQRNKFRWVAYYEKTKADKAKVGSSIG